MSKPLQQLVQKTRQDLVEGWRTGWSVLRRKGPSQVQFWFIALAVGIAAGLVTVSFRHAINFLQTTV
ncbi:MAG: chloride channel protein, partial [Rhodovulum sp.]|nr:chloride channel protein [Rhodovulum sp.]